jgi:multiple sugar transport system ATP-binding protein
MASVSLQDVCKSFDATPVVKGISLAIEDGQFCVLVGPSGCGKSTLLRLLAGLEPIDSGSIRIGDRDVSQVPPKDRDIAMVFQNYALYPNMTVRENMAFSLNMAGAGKVETRQRVDDAAQILGLVALLDRRPRQLSGGQRQRVAMGRAIVRKPQVFLFDEPLSNLDAKLRVHMRTELKALHQRLRTTTIHVTHDQIEAMTLADQVVVMRDGRIEQVGRPLDLYDRPANRFVAGFIGSPEMNFIRGTLDRDVCRTADGGQLPVPDVPERLLGRQVVCGVRPEHFTLDPGGEPFEVVTVEPTGSETTLSLRRGQSQWSVLLRERIHPNPGDAIRLRVQPGRVHLFDPDSGERMAGA